MDGVPTTELVAAMVKPTAGKSHGASTLMTDGEFQDFWHLLDARRFAEFQQQAAPTPQVRTAAAPRPAEGAKTRRIHNQLPRLTKMASAFIALQMASVQSPAVFCRVAWFSELEDAMVALPVVVDHTTRGDSAGRCRDDSKTRFGSPVG